MRGRDGGATFVDDYAHVPSEISAVLSAARDSGDGWGRVVAVFQPNRFNRIAEMWQDFADAFVAADVVVLTDIYASGTTPIPGVTGRLIVDAVQDAHPDAHVVWLPRRDDLISFLAGEVGAGGCLHLDGVRRRGGVARRGVGPARRASTWDDGGGCQRRASASMPRPACSVRGPSAMWPWAR